MIGITGVVVVFGLALIGVYLILAPQTQAAPPQPIAFNHEVMVQAGVPCLYCHTGATQSTVAAIPSVGKCMGGHRAIPTDNPEVKKLTMYWQEQNQFHGCASIDCRVSCTSGCASHLPNPLS